MGTEITRLAPSPTGALHLGNARTFVVNWALARRHGWRIVLRMEDLDGPRVKMGAAERAISTLEWLGMDWDVGPIYQSHDLAPYQEAMDVLAAHERVYPCTLSRREIQQAASAPHAEDHETAYPLELRPSSRPRAFNDTGANWRFVVDEGPTAFEDEFVGPVEADVITSVGDFVVWTKHAQPAYQLAVVVDDHRQGVTRVVRGDDLVRSTARQLQLYRALRYAEEPHYLHLPLVYGPDGRRLAKRHGDTRVDTYRQAGVSAERVIALLARWCGLGEHDAMSAAEFAAGLDLARMPLEAVVMTPEDDRWLTARA